MRTIPALVVLLVSAGQVAAQQQPDGSANRAAISRLSFMLGRWRGEAWMDRGGRRVQTTMTETVEPKLEGTVLEIHGRGAMQTPQGERVVHEALGVLYFDAAAGAYVLRSWIGAGHTGEFTVAVQDSAVTWSRGVPGGQVRNTARFNGGVWHEIGEFSADGTAWQQVMEIRLRREE